MGSENMFYSIRQSDGISPIPRHNVAAWRYHERGWFIPGEELLYLIDLKLPNLAGERPQALAEALAKLEYKFGSEEGWENKAKDYLRTYEGTEWMDQQFVRADELGSGGVRPSGSADREQQTVKSDRDSFVQKSDGGTPTLSQESSQIPQVPETNFLEEILPSSPMGKAMVAGTALLAAVFVWQHYTRS